MTWVVYMCIGLMCTNLQPTRYEYRTHIQCVAKAKLLKWGSTHPAYIRTGCHPKR
jgi:hypothetical protein